jgi:hypothetical protein
MTPLFRHYTGPSKKALDRQLETFAELLSLDHPLSAIADEMRITMGTACHHLVTLCRMYGEEARG